MQGGAARDRHEASAAGGAGNTLLTHCLLSLATLAAPATALADELVVPRGPEIGINDRGEQTYPSALPSVAMDSQGEEQEC